MKHNMTAGLAAPGARAARLLRWYPRAWRSRYGEEFAELLVADIEERPRSRSRTADVIRGGLVARLGDGRPVRRRARARDGAGSHECQPGLAGLLRGRLRRRRRRHVVPAHHRLAVVRAAHGGRHRGHVHDVGGDAGPGRRGAARRAPGGVAGGHGPAAGPARPVRAVRGRAGRRGRRRQALRQRLAGHRRPPVGPPGPGAGRGGGLLLGVDPVRLLVLGSSRRAGRVPRGRAGLDGPQPAGRGGRGGRRGHRGPAGRPVTGRAALRDLARPRGLRRHGRLPRRGLRLGRPGPAERAARGRSTPGRSTPPGSWS